MKVEKTNIEKYKYTSTNNFYIFTIKDNEFQIEIFDKSYDDIITLLPQHIKDLAQIFNEHGLEHESTEG